MARGLREGDKITGHSVRGGVLNPPGRPSRRINPLCLSQSKLKFFNFSLPPKTLSNPPESLSNRPSTRPPPLSSSDYIPPLSWLATRSDGRSACSGKCFADASGGLRLRHVSRV